MTRATNTPATKKRRKRILDETKGYEGSGRKLLKTAKERLMRSRRYAYRDRKIRKRFFARIWNIRISNGVSEYGLSYSRFKRLLILAQVKLDRKQLAKILTNEPEHFSKLIEKLKNP